MPTHGPDLSRFNLTQLRALTGLAERTIRKRLGDLQPIARDGRTVWYPARDALERIYLSEALNPQLERARLNAARREQIEERLARDRADWILAASMDRVLVQLARATRDRILAVPNAIGPRLPRGDLTNRFLRLLDDALREALSEIADQGDAALARIDRPAT